MAVVENVVLPAPATVSRNPPLVMPPVSVSVPAIDPIVVADPIVIGPAHELVPLTFSSAPAPPPVPFSVRASAPTAMVPCTSSRAGLVTLTPPATVPNAVAFWMSTTPALTVVAPVYVLAPVNVRVPLPDIVSPPVPLIAAVENVVLPAPATVIRNPPLTTPPVPVSVPAVDPIVLADPSVITPAQELVPLTFSSAPVPPPVPFNVSASAPTAIVPCSSNRAPLVTLTPPATVPNAVAFWILTTPALIAVAPVYVLAPVNVSVPLPDIVSPPVPLMAAVENVV